jgi:glycosyltransferase involved in cell wall biosynthesis
MSFRLTLTALDRCLAVAASCAKFEECHHAICDPRINWLTLIALANRYLVVPALWTALVQTERLQQVPEDVRGYLALLHSRNAARNARIRQQCVGLGAFLMRGGIRAVLLKGAAWLFDGSVAPPFDRMMQSIDLLIASDQIEAAVTTLVSVGYRDTCDSVVEKPQLHHAPLLPPGGEASVKLHRDLSHRVNLLPSDELIGSASEVAPGLLLPMVRHRIAHNVIHAQIETGNFVGGILNLRDALDLARLVVRCGPEFDWGALADEARDRGFFHHLSGAIYATHRFLGSPLPIPLKSLRARIHASRCAHQRQWPVANEIFENIGLLTCAFAWDRDAYPLRLGTDRSLRARILVNRRRAQRAKVILGQLRLEVPKFLKGGKRENVTEKPDERPVRHSSVLHTPTQHALKRVFRPDLAVAARERTPVLLDWAASNTYGWGIVGLNTFMVWANDHDLQPLMGAPITEDSFAGYAPERVRAVEWAIGESNRLQSDLAQLRAAVTRVGVPIIKVFGNGLHDPGGIVGTPNIGRCIFEDARLEKLDEKLANCDVVVCASHWNADLLRAKTPKRIEVIHEGVDNTLFRPVARSGQLDQSKFYIFSGGKVEYRKGHDLVLLAFKEFSRHHDDAVLVTSWHSPWPQLSEGFKGKLNAPLELTDIGTINVEKWVVSNGIAPEKVIVIKQIPNLLMPRVLRDMHCAVFPSRAEAGTSLPAKEAMACGIPVILAANTGLKDLIGSGNCIALTEQKPIHDCGTEYWGESNIEEIVQALERLYADSSYRERTGREGAAWILAHQRTWVNHARQLKSLIMSF